MILGHEVAGEIVEIGAKVTQLKLGDRVTVEPEKACGTCNFCRQQSYNLCTTRVGA